MSDRRRGLGRGLGALIPPGPTIVGGSRTAGGSSALARSPVDVLIPGRPADGAGEPGAPAADGAGEPGAPAVGRAAGPSTTDPAAGPVAPGAADRSAPNHRDVGAHFVEIPVDAITANPRQPRTAFDEDEMAELAHSIREVGLLQPVVVRPAGADRFELVMGERRWRACRAAGLEWVPAIVRSTADDRMLRDALLENLHRSQLNPLEEAAAYDQLLQDFGCTHEELAQRVGRSRPQITNTLRLLRLPPLVQRRVAAGVLAAGHARALLGLDDPAAQERLAQRIVAEGLSVRSVEEVVALGDLPGDSAGVPAPIRRPRRPVAPGLADLAARLADRFETRVKVDLGRTKGKIVMEFASLDDLDRILLLMAPEVRAGDTGDGAS